MHLGIGPIAVAAILQTALLVTPAQAGTPSGAIKDDAFDFGVIRQGSPVKHTFVIRNAGTTPLRVSGMALSLPEMTARMSSPEIAAGAEASIAIEMRTDRLTGLVEAMAQITWTDSSQPELRLTLGGQVSGPIAIEPLPAIYLSTYASDPAERVLTLRNNEAQALAITKAEHSQRIEVSVTEADAGKVFTIRVRPADDLPVGRYDESLRLRTNLPSADAISLPVHLWVRPDLDASPERVDFGAVRARDPTHDGDKAPRLPTQTFFLTRHGGSFAIRALECDVAGVEVTQSPAGSSERFQIDVRLRPDLHKPGGIEGTIRIETTDPRFPRISVPLSATVM